MYQIGKYRPEDTLIWDEFVGNAKNNHFSFLRTFMDYHSDRFDDFSLIIFDSNSAVVALFPANKSMDVIHSHQGLTFGGLIYKRSTKQASVISIFEAIIAYFKEAGVNRIVYKVIPWIYSDAPSEEDQFALFLLGAKNIRKEVSSTIDLRDKIPYGKGRKWSVKKAKSKGLDISEVFEFGSFWPQLENVLSSMHDISPTHSQSEIEKLARRFPKNIRTFSVFHLGEIVAGIVIFVTSRVAHVQYMFSTPDGRELGALDLLIDRMIDVDFSDMHYFDFGISTEDHGRYLNEGLIAQKEAFGARAVCHDLYEIEL